MYKNIILLAAATLVLSACSQESPKPEQQAAKTDAVKTEPAAKMEPTAATPATDMTEAQKRDYALGANSAGFLVRSFLEFESWGMSVDKALVLKGFKDTMEDKSELSPQEMQTVLMALQKEIKDKIAQVEAEQLATATAANKVFMDAYAAKEGVKTTESGLMYRMVTEGSGKLAVAGDIVRVHYKGTLVDGSEFDSSYKRGQPIDFSVERVIPGWAEGVKLVKEGGKIELVMGPELAYGAQASETIPAHSALYFEVELVKINPEPAPAPTEEAKQ